MKNLQYKALSVLLSLGMTAALCGSVPTAVMADTIIADVITDDPSDPFGDDSSEGTSGEGITILPDDDSSEGTSGEGIIIIPGDDSSEDTSGEGIIPILPGDDSEIDIGDKIIPTVHTHNDQVYTALTAEGGKLESGYYYLDQDITLEAPYYLVGENSEFTICLNGHTITAGDSVPYIFALDTSESDYATAFTFTLDDCSEDASGTLTGAAQAAIYFNHNDTSSVFIMNHGNILHNGHGVYTETNMEMNDGSICYNDSTNASQKIGAGIYCGGADYFQINGGTISYNTAPYDTGIYCGSIDEVHIENATISYNTASATSAGICLGGCGSWNDADCCTINNCIINNNTASGGAAIYVGGTGFTVSNSQICDNTTTGDGGAIYIGGCTTKINNTTISRNTSGNNGGAIYAGGSSNSEINDSILSDNTGVKGGAVYFSGGSFTVSGSEFSGNTSSEEGGALYSGGATITYNNTNISGNTAGKNGGAMYSGGGTITFNNTNISGNTTENDGGGIYSTGVTLTYNGGSIRDNKAVNGGGIYHSAIGLTLADVDISNNTATSNGGGIDLEGGYPFNFSGTLITGNTADGLGSGVYLKNTSSFTVNSGSIINNSGDNLYIPNETDSTTVNNRIYTISADYDGKIGIHSQNPDTYFYKGSDAENYLSNFTSDDEHYTVVADENGLKLQITYAVNVEDAEGGTVTASVARAIEGTTVTLTTEANKGYKFDSLKVMQGDTELEVTDNTFVMPAEDVTVIATFVPHVHGDWAYTAEDTTVTAVCNSEGICDLEEAPAITLKAEDAVYTGKAAEAVLEGADAWEAAGLTLPEITYTYKASEDAAAAAADAPVNAGYYTASITCGDAAVSTDFAIAKSVPTYEVPTGLTATEGNTLADVTLPEGFAWADASASVGEAGVNTFEAVYTPADTTNYEVVTGIKLEVTVKAAEPETPEKTDKEIFTEYKANAAEGLNSLLKKSDNTYCKKLVAAAQKFINSISYNKNKSLKWNEKRVDKAVALATSLLKVQLKYLRKYPSSLAYKVALALLKATLG